MRLNSRLTGTVESATLAINQKSRALRAQGNKVALWGFGESPFPVHENMRAALAENAHQKSYLPSLGLPKLREAIAGYYRDVAGYDFDPGRIAIAPGSKESIFHLLMAIEGPLVLPSPSWVSYRPQAHLLGKDVIDVPTGHSSGYKVDPGDLDAIMRKANPSQSVMILNSPNNPTGQRYGDGQLKAIAEVCRKHNVYVISDEIYAELAFGGNGIAPGVGSHCPERAVMTGGLSKSRGAGGWRLGFAAGCDESSGELFAALAALISETYSCVSAPVQHAAVVAYQDSEVGEYIKECSGILESVSSFTRDSLLEAGVDCLPGTGGFYLYPNFRPFADALEARGLNDASSLTKALLDEAGIALLPAEDFGGKADSFACRLAAVDFDGSLLLDAYRNNDGVLPIPEQANELLTDIVAGCGRLGEWLQALNP